MLSEIRKIPQKALEIYEKNQGLQLPQKVYYLGLGASHCASLVLRYCGKKIYPETADEFNHYLNPREKLPLGILISLYPDNQPVLASRSLFYEYIAIVNNSSNPLLQGNNLLQSVDLGLADEIYHSSMPYLALLIVLYQGLDLDCYPAIDYIRKDFDYYEAKGRLMAEEIEKHDKKYGNNMLFILGNGPNVATAKQAALMLGKVSRRAVTGMSFSHYDHNFRDDPGKHLTIIINDNGPGKDSTTQLIDRIKNEGRKCIFIEEIDLSWIYTPINLILPFDFAAYYLGRKIKTDPAIIFNS
jgi:glutamine---fructose-6-phosphate transaminase (isomerizing)